MTFADLACGDLFVPVVWDDECAQHAAGRHALDGIVLCKDRDGCAVAKHWCRLFVGERRDAYATPMQRVRRCGRNITASV